MTRYSLWTDRVFEQIQSPCNVFSSVLGFSIDSFDDETEEFVVTRNGDINCHEVDKRVIETRLHDALTEYMQGNLTHNAYSQIHDVMGRQYRNMIGPQRE